MKSLIAAAAWALRLCGPARAADDDARARAEVLAQLDRFFVGMSAHDPKAWSDVLLEDMVTHSQNFGPDGKVTLRRNQAKDMIANLPGGPAMNEGVWAPTVLIRGPMAVVWAPYEFKLEGKSHHCGIDVFDFVKVDGAWKMASAMWTAEPAACAELKAAKSPPN
jgi:hypothetical protein